MNGGRARAPEVPRDQMESEFTEILRALWSQVPQMVAVTFVDVEGECIDYVSSVDIFEAKVAAAHMQVMMRSVRDSPAFAGEGEPFVLEIATDSHEVWGRRVAEEYVLVALLEGQVDRARLRVAMADACRAFCREVGLPAPSWEGVEGGLKVGLRDAITWPYAPDSVTVDGTVVAVADVLGHWSDADHGLGKLECFRVRTAAGEELTLVHAVRDDVWSIRAH